MPPAQRWATRMALFLSLFLPKRPFSRVVLALVGASSLGSIALAQEIPFFYIREYRVEGVKKLKNLEVEEAVYPYLGPQRTAEDVEQARVALEKVYHDKGFSTVSVVIPQQDPRRGVIRLEVTDSKVGRLRVNGARYFLPSRIKREASSMAEGTVPNMNDVQKEILALNRLGDRRVTPQLRSGSEPGTVDIDLNVEDKLPLHGSLELNNWFNANTTPLRLSGALSYSNLFQLGHSAGASVLLAPENTDDSLVFTGYYTARVSEGMSLTLQGTKQYSDIATAASTTVSGPGEIIGLRAIYDLPLTDKFYQTLSLGVDYKNFREDLKIGNTTISSPIEYLPLSVNYGASLTRPKGFTEFNTSLNFHLRGIGSGQTDYNNRRSKSGGNYVFLRSDVSNTRDLKNGSQIFGKIQGQVSSKPLINAEQISGGGAGTVRGYLEATALGDNAVFSTIEYRGPSFIGTPDKLGIRASEWRLHTFVEGGVLGIYDALPAQQAKFWLASFGVGTRFKYASHFNGSIDLAMPLVDQTEANAGDVRVTFRGWADF
jgi:hemolysin activation/secretion protein